MSLDEATLPHNAKFDIAGSGGTYMRYTLLRYPSQWLTYIHMSIKDQLFADSQKNQKYQRRLTHQ